MHADLVLSWLSLLIYRAKDQELAPPTSVRANKAIATDTLIAQTGLGNPSLRLSSQVNLACDKLKITGRSIHNFELRIFSKYPQMKVSKYLWLVVQILSYSHDN